MIVKKGGIPGRELLTVGIGDGETRFGFFNASSYRRKTSRHGVMLPAYGSFVRTRLGNSVMK